jgi:hypothetical protein
VRYIGPKAKARAKYAMLFADMRRGSVELYDGEGKTIERDWARRRKARS